MAVAVDHCCKTSGHRKKGNGTNLPEIWLTCGQCLTKFKTICMLHLHIEGHKEGGSYTFDNITKTAFPKYDTVCAFTQVEESILNELRSIRAPYLQRETEEYTKLQEDSTSESDSSSADSFTTVKKEQNSKALVCKRKRVAVIPNNTKKRVVENQFLPDDKLCKKAVIRLERSTGNSDRSVKESASGTENKNKQETVYGSKQPYQSNQSAENKIILPAKLTSHFIPSAAGNAAKLKDNSGLPMVKSMGESIAKPRAVIVKHVQKETGYIKTVKAIPVSGKPDASQSHMESVCSKPDHQDIKIQMMPSSKDSHSVFSSAVSTLTTENQQKLGLNSEDVARKLVGSSETLHRKLNPASNIRKHPGMFHVEESGKDPVIASKSKEHMTVLVVTQYDNDIDSEELLSLQDVKLSEPRSGQNLKDYNVSELKAGNQRSRINPSKHECDELNAGEALIAISQSKFVKKKNVSAKGLNECAQSAETLNLSGTTVQEKNGERNDNRHLSNILEASQDIVRQEMHTIHDGSSDEAVTVKKRRVRHDYKCPVCGKVGTSSMVSYHKHIHKEEKELTCDVCGAMFQSPGCLRMHLKSHREKEFKCDQCPAEFHRKKYFEVHMLKHSGLKPHRCEACGKSYRDAEHLKRHVRHVHEQIRKFECDLCGDRFFRSDHLKCHRARHSAPGLKCKVCKKSFKLQTDLDRHSVVHLDDKKWCCQLCGKGFRAAVSYYKHMSGKHDLNREAARETKTEKKFTDIVEDETHAVPQPVKVSVEIATCDRNTRTIPRYTAFNTADDKQQSVSCTRKNEHIVNVTSMAEVLPSKGRILIVKRKRGQGYFDKRMLQEDAVFATGSQVPSQSQGNIIYKQGDSLYPAQVAANVTYCDSYSQDTVGSEVFSAIPYQDNVELFSMEATPHENQLWVPIS